VKLCRDMLVVREFPRESLGVTFDGWTGYDAKAAYPYPAGVPGQTWLQNGTSARSCVSFNLAETDDAVSSSGLTLRGYTTRFSATFFDGDKIDVASLNGPNDKLVLDHTGMLAQLVNAGANVNGRVYRIVEVQSKTRLKVVDSTGAAPGFVSGDFPGGTHLVIAPGPYLVKSDNYDKSTAPDVSAYPIELFGSSLALNPINGLRNFEGVVYGAKWGCQIGQSYAGGTDNISNALIFESYQDGAALSGCEMGVDQWADQDGSPSSPMSLPHVGRSAGQLFVQGNRSRGCFDVRDFAGASTPYSSQPNDALAVTVHQTKSEFLTSLTFAGEQPAKGLRRIVLQYFDPINNARSAPSDVMSVDPSIGDKPNTIGRIRFRLEGLPRSPDRRDGLLTEVYSTLPDGADFFRVAAAPADTSEVEWVVNDAALEDFGEPLDPSSGAPPRAKVVSAARSSLWYGNLDGQPDGIAFSAPFQPEVVPASQIENIDTGDRVAITAMHPLGEQMVVFKRVTWCLPRMARLPFLRSTTPAEMEQSARSPWCPWSGASTSCPPAGCASLMTEGGLST
jgi:hypothetical protein